MLHIPTSNRSDNPTGLGRLMILASWMGSFSRLRLNGSGDTVVLMSGASASFTYLVEPQLRREEAPWTVVDITLQGAHMIDWSRYRRAVVVRYAPGWLLRKLKQFRRAGGQVVYFMDDDLMDPAVLKELPRNYQRKILALATSRRKNIEALCDEYWVSTSYLAEKYAGWSPRLISPVAPVKALGHVARASVCYHGTSSHQAEQQWLKGVIDGVHAKSEALNFEVFGDHAVNRLFRLLPRVAVLHPMSWNSYLDYTASVSRDIGLAPLLPNQFNDARGATKFFDFVRMGAVGIYSDVAPYRGFIRNEVDGVLLPNDPYAWIDTILALAADTPRRERMAAAARDRALALALETDTSGDSASARQCNAEEVANELYKSNIAGAGRPAPLP